MISPLSGKLKLLYVDPYSFMALFKEGLEVREGYKLVKGLPEDAEIKALSLNPENLGVILIIASEKFRTIKKGENLPFLMVDIQPTAPVKE